LLEKQRRRAPYPRALRRRFPSSNGLERRERAAAGREAAPLLYSRTEKEDAEMKSLWAFSLASLVAFGIIRAPGKALLDRVLETDVHGVLDRPLLLVGKQPITLLFVIKGILLLVFLAVVARAARVLLESRLLPKTSMAPGQRYAFARAIAYGVFLIGLVVGLQSSGLNLNSLLVLGGAVGVGLGFGLQNIANNFVSGLILLFEQPIRVGDRVEVGNTIGDVVKIAMRSTWIRTNENVVIIVPNSEFVSERVTNWTANDPLVRFSLSIGVGYGSDVEKVREVLFTVARANPDVLRTPEPEVLFNGFGDSALNFELRVWSITKVHMPGVLRSDLYFAMFKALQASGIEIPFPQRDLHLRSVSAAIPVVPAASSSA
jgi:small-conductance mechanosensitive channel